jgi:heme-degrading monooxygenase HmoA
MVGSAFVLRGPPRPAFYDALATTSVVPKDIPKAVDGWRVVDADGINTLPVECFIGMEKYFVLPEMQFTFEKFWTARESTLAKVEGFVAFSMMRRDGQAKGHGVSEISEKEPNYVGTIVFKDRASHDKWKVEHEAESMARKSSGPPPPKMWNKAPEKVYYEGTLVLSSTLGP